MKTETKNNLEIFYKILIILTFIISIIILSIMINSNIPEKTYIYETKLIELNNTNDFSYVDGEVIDFVCDEGVYFSNHGYSYYASTWEYDSNNPTVMYGKCFIKIQKEDSGR